MRPFVRIDDVRPFCLQLQDGLLLEHYKEIAEQYYKGLFDDYTVPPPLLLLRCIHFQGGDCLLDFRKRKAPVRAAPEVDPELQHIVGRILYRDDLGDKIEDRIVLAKSAHRARAEPDSLIKAADPDRLLMKISDPAADRYTCDVFWLTFRQYMTPANVLTKLLARYDVPPLDGPAPGPAAPGGAHAPAQPARRHRSPLDELHYAAVEYEVRAKVMEALVDWATEYPWDWTASMVTLAQQWIRHRSRDEVTASELASVLRRVDRRPFHERRQQPLFENAAVATSRLPIQEYPPREIAEQLTLLCAEAYQHIHPLELVGKLWDNPETRHHTPNLQRYRDFAYQVANFVQCTIVRERLPRSRMAVLALWLEVCNELKRLHSWDMLHVVFSLGLLAPAVTALRGGSALPPAAERLDRDLVEFLDPRGQFKALKQAVQQDAEAGVAHSVPVALYLPDLIQLEDGHKLLDEAGFVNFARAMQLYNLITDTLDQQSALWPFAANHQLQSLFVTWTILSPERVQELGREAAFPPAVP